MTGSDFDAAAPPAEPPSSARTVVLISLCAAAAIAYVQRNCIGVAESTIRAELGMTKQQMGWALSGFFLTYSLFQIPTGWLGERLGPRKTLPFYSAAWSGATAITGLAGTAAVILASSRDGDINAYDVLDDNLELRWSARLKGEIRALPVIADEQIFVRTVDGQLSALSLGDGSIQWTVSRRVPALSLTGNSQPIIRGDLVIAGFDDGKISAFSRVDGQTVWETTVSRSTGRTEIERLVDLDGQFILKDGIIYISSYQGRLAAIQAVDGNLLWSRKFSSYQSIVADEEALYLSGDNSHIWSIDRRTGSAFWKQEVLHARKITAPLLIGDKLVVADLEGYVHWLDKSDGSLRGRVRPTRSRHIAQPLIWDNRIMVIDSEGILSSLYLKNSP